MQPDSEKDESPCTYMFKSVYGKRVTLDGSGATSIFHSNLAVLCAKEKKFIDEFNTSRLVGLGAG
ncbi:hypothetical protein J6590_080508 [Homalodisca vitripennis]|nr:hypothetical protein J6590_080508 [Homalodisca vitripennis]